MAEKCTSKGDPFKTRKIFLENREKGLVFTHRCRWEKIPLLCRRKNHPFKKDDFFVYRVRDFFPGRKSGIFAEFGTSRERVVYGGLRAVKRVTA